MASTPTHSNREVARFELRLPLDVNAAIQELASRGDRTKNAQIVRALRYYIQNAKGDE